MTGVSPSISRGLLFTAFEPSGDLVAAPVIRAFRERFPDAPIHAWGGPAMADAGAELVESSTSRAVMLHDAAREVLRHRRRVRRIRRWMAEHQPAVHIPVDSPAANFANCESMRRVAPTGRIVHLVAPQLWAWGEGRVVKLRRLTDEVLCLLPFEKKWFTERDVPATFVGHPLFSPDAGEDLDAEGAARRLDLPADRSPRLLLLPGSRLAEAKRNFPLMIRMVERLQRDMPRLGVLIAAANEVVEPAIRERLGDRDWPVRRGVLETALCYADAAVAVSGTVTLQVVARRCPVVVLYVVPAYQWRLVGRFVVRTRTFALPNLVAERLGGSRVAPEFVPHLGDERPLVEAVGPLLRDPDARFEQLARGEAVRAVFQDTFFERTTVDRIAAHHAAAHDAAATASS